MTQFHKLISDLVRWRQDFNLETCEGEYVQTSEWSQKSIQLCRDIISGNVLDIKYDIQAKQGDVYFGHVIVTKLAKRSKTNPITNLAHALRNTDEAMEMPGFSAGNFCSKFCLFRLKLIYFELNLTQI